MADAGGLTLVFDPALDGHAWPGPLADREAVFGETWCGPLGLLARLETELGLVAAPLTTTERALELAQQLPTRPGYWSASFDADPLATAKRLLADRDLLALWGWRGQPVSDRLGALWTATADCAVGIPDRIRRIVELVPRRSLDIATITTFDSPDTLPPLWRALFDTLTAAGVTLTRRALPIATASGDLGGARVSPFTPTGDGSLTLVRTQGPLAAAEEVASALAACKSLDGIVVIGADGVLDAAFAQHGLPRLGMPRGPTGSSALVRLVVETAFQPMDPDDLHALICADPGPVHGRLKRRLARAIAKFPARGSHEWQEALSDGLAKIEDEKRDAVAARIEALVSPAVKRGEDLSIDALAARMRALATWAHGRATSEPSLRGTAVLAERLTTLARRTGLAGFERGVLRRLVDELDMPVLGGGGAEVGLATVGGPGAIVGPARAVIWWNFTRASAPGAPRLRLTTAEQGALRYAGVTPPDIGALMAAEARRWRRPLEQARDALVLVCPRVDEAGERAHPHPLWDELVASLPPGSGALVSKLESTHVRLPATARRMKVKLRPVVVPVDEVRAPAAALALGEVESPSSLEVLLSCSLRWALERKGLLWSGLGTGPGAPTPLHYGNIAHHVLEHVFGSEVASPDEAAARAEALFDAQAGVLAEALHLPDYQTKRAELRRGVVLSAREVARLVGNMGARVKGLEVDVEGKLGAAKVKGRADMLLAGPDTVIDFKWGWSTYRELLKTGTAFQLAAYAALTKTGRKLPDVGYLALHRQQVLAPHGSQLPGAKLVGQHTVKEMIDGAVTRLNMRTEELERGVLQAPSAVEDVEAGALDDGVMTIAPKCQYCELGTLCGRRTRP